MKKNLLILTVAIAAVLVSGSIIVALLFFKKEPGAVEKKTTENVRIFEGEVDVCKIFPQEKISNILGKSFIKTEGKKVSDPKFVEYQCAYYLSENHNVLIRVVRGDIENLHKGYELVGWVQKTDPDVSLENIFIYTSKNRFRAMNLRLADNLEIEIDMWASTLSDQDAVKFCKNFAEFFKENFPGVGRVRAKVSPTKESVPLPQDEDLVKSFVSFIEEGKASEAALMMKTQDDSELQAWGVQFSNIMSFKLLKMEKANEQEWTKTKHIYKVLLDVKMDPRSADAPIPYYGWQDGENIRWIILEKVGDIWKIAEIATGL